MDNDDQQIGHVLSRREVLALLGTAGVTLLVGCGPQQAGTATTPQATAGAAPQATAAAPVAATTQATAGAAAATPALNEEAQTAVSLPTAAVPTAGTASAVTVPACVVRPEVTEGPYYVVEDLVRSDIRTDPTTGTAKDGTPLVLTFNVSQVSNSACTPLTGATVEVWHCDATGAYSDVTDPSFTTVGQKWLRGAQVTDANGRATFTTIYPGWYSGRAVHIHYKVHPDTTKVFTSQLFFDDKLSQQVFTQAAYTNKSNTPDTLNSTDSIYQELMLLTTTKTDQGYATTFDIGMDLSTLGTGQSGGGQGGGPGGPPPSQPTQQP